MRKTKKMILSGDLSIKQIDGLFENLKNYLETQNQCLIEIKKITHIDFTFLQMLWAFTNSAQTLGKAYEIRSVGQDLSKIFEQYGINIELKWEKQF